MNHMTSQERKEERKQMQSERAKFWETNEFEIQCEKRLPKYLQNIMFRINLPKIETIKSSYIFGPVGTGKTVYAICLFLEHLHLCYIEHGCYANDAGIFITVPELLMKCRSIYNKKPDQEENGESCFNSEIELVNYYSNVDFLILDDFGVEKTTDWSFQMLYMIVNNRYNNERLTVFTSNFNLAELAIRLGDERLPSRINHMCEVVQKNINYRK